MLIVTALGYGFAKLIGLPVTEGVIFGFCLSIASTVVLLRTLEDRHLALSPVGNAALCWLIVQDLIAVFALVAIVGHRPAQGRGRGVQQRDHQRHRRQIGRIGGVRLHHAGRRPADPARPAGLHRQGQIARSCFRSGVFAIALGIAYAANAIFGAGFALGAFFAGLVLNEAELSQRAAEDMLPLRDAFAVLFFVSVGHAVRSADRHDP